MCCCGLMDGELAVGMCCGLVYLALTRVAAVAPVGPASDAGRGIRDQALQSVEYMYLRSFGRGRRDDPAWPRDALQSGAINARPVRLWLSGSSLSGSTNRGAEPTVDVDFNE